MIKTYKIEISDNEKSRVIIVEKDELDKFMAAFEVIKLALEELGKK